LSYVTVKACVEDFQKYSDTVVVAAAIYHLFVTNTFLGHFVGEEHTLTGATSTDILTPDITTLYDGNSKAVLFDFKYSLSSDPRSVKDELLELAKYASAKQGWGVKGSVQQLDFVLICHVDDVKRAVDAAREIYSDNTSPFYDPKRFSVWTWTMSVSKGATKKEEMRLQWEYGSTRNDALQKSIQQAGGIIVGDEVLTMLRFQYPFIRQKPPVQYTTILLIQNVFSALQRPSMGGKAEYQVDLDLVYDRTKILFPPWWESNFKTVQLKRQWIKEALDLLVDISLIGIVQGKTEAYSIPIPTLVTRKPLPTAICERLGALLKRRRRNVGRVVSTKRVSKKKSVGTRPLTEFFGRNNSP
jgi:hypothetical protein